MLTLPRDVFQGSRIIQWSLRHAARCQAWGSATPAWGACRAAWRSGIEIWRAAPLRTGGFTLIAAVLANGACLWLLGRTIDAFGITQRILLLAVGAFAASQAGHWRLIRQGSWLLRAPDAPQAKQQARRASDRAVRRPVTPRTYVYGAIALACVGALVSIAELPSRTRQGINFLVTARPVPLYQKALAFLLRDAEYRRLAAEMTRGLRGDEPRAMALALWTHDHIRPTPRRWPVVDDHILNIIIRGYGEEDQAADVFTTLAAYAGLPAFWKIVRARSGNGVVVLSFVRIQGAWTVWEARRGVGFRNAQGGLARIEELKANPALAELTMGGAMRGDQPYRIYLEDGLSSLAIPAMLRPHLQMPWRRVAFEIQRFCLRSSSASLP